MLTVEVSATLNELTTKFAGLTGRQIPFASALALTRTAHAARIAVINEMRDVFDRPTPYTLSGVEVKEATPQARNAKVALKSFAGKGIAAATFLAPQITGGVRRLKRFERALQLAGYLPDGFRVVPGSGAELDSYGNIKPSQLVQILSYFRSFKESAGYRGFRSNMTDQRRKRLARGSKTKRGFEYFVGRPGRAPLGVWQRTGFAHGSAIKPVLIFVREARYEAIFDFGYVVETTARKQFRAHFEAALSYAIATAR